MRSALQFPSRTSDLATWLWIGLIGVASVLLGWAFACVMPFAALATLAVFTLRRREAFALVLFVWIANQVVGFGLLHYPWTGSTFAWGVAIGVAALAGLIASLEVERGVMLATWVVMPLTLVAAFGTYELVLHAITWLLHSGPSAFAPVTVLRVFAVNCTALGLLFAAQRLTHTAAVHLQEPSPASR